MENTKWNSLPDMERKKLSTELIHCLQDDGLFNTLCEIINKAKEDGLFDNVVMFPDSIADQPT